MIEVWFVDVVCLAGRFPATEKIKESLLGSCAVIVIVADVFTVTLTSVGPTKISGGKFAIREEFKKRKLIYGLGVLGKRWLI